MNNSAHSPQPQFSPPSNTSSSFVKEKLKEGKKANRLLQEKSPYLLQHAFNPVDWYPWGEEAFEKARKEDKPIFLSIGYSTCYWCHVMEREVFEDSAIASLMNDKLVCIKVDREERPDVDRVYMTAVQAITGSGGWPMSVFMTPDRKPFYGGTYIPPTAQYGRPGFPDLVKRIDELWHNERAKLLESSEQITAMLKTQSSPAETSMVGKPVLDSAYNQFFRGYDDKYAGFGSGPKFPRPVVLNFLLRYYHRTGNESALNMVTATLQAMAHSGMYDHLGGGFHRYSVDGEWRVPHFEKMLYDQAQLVTSYLEAYQITHDDEFASVARDVLNYVRTDLTDAGGGFYSAEDAESALDKNHPEVKEEGAFYLWTKAEIEANLTPEQAEVFCYRFGVEDSGNALHDPQNAFFGKNILYIAHTMEETAFAIKKTEDDLNRLPKGVRQKLLAIRNQRPRPHLDDKIITAWNGLMISAFSKASQVLEDKEYLEAATRAAQFIESKVYDSRSGTLYRRYRDGEARFEGGLQDYAFFIQGLLDLYEASFDVHWLDLAIELTKKQIALFQDSTNGGFYDVSGNDSTILVRTKEDYDGAEPAGNSVAALNVLRLSRMTDNENWKKLGEQTVQAVGGRIQKYPEVAPQLLVALDWSLVTPKEVIIAGSADSPDTRALLREVHRSFVPDKVILLLDSRGSRQRIARLLPFTSSMNALEGKATIYVCENFACKLPTSDPKAVHSLLNPAPPGN
ncbi:MAG TPA: thioredoxin domain-containing protein [Bacteroidota bacterium]|nr:thioredoxin domain-containing protein [Bacteroidota bacterium]